MAAVRLRRGAPCPRGDALAGLGAAELLRGGEERAARAARRVAATCGASPALPRGGRCRDEDGLPKGAAEGEGAGEREQRPHRGG